MGAQQSMEIEIAGVVDHDRIAWLNQEAAEQIDRLRPGFRQDDLVGRCLDAVLAETPRQKLA
ncbi:hypothetical protein D3C80_2195400 [compost metagenome]